MAAYKGPAGQDEEQAGRVAAATLGGTFVESLTGELPEGLGARRILIYRKTGETPEKYPRRAGVPARRPIYTRERLD